jgi:hypothetical protein
LRSKSIKGKSTEEIKTALTESMSDGFSPALAIIFVSVNQDRKGLCEIMQAEGIEVFGATSSGEFINGHESDGEIVVLLLDLRRDNYTIILEEIGEKTLEEAAAVVAKESIHAFANPALVLCSTGVKTNGEFFDGVSLVHNIERALGHEKVFFGGMAGDDMKLEGTFVFTHNKETNYGVVALVLNADKISLCGMAITGWKPMGISRRVTKSEGSLLYSIDDKPAVEMYLKYLGQGEKREVKDYNLMNELAFYYPFITERDQSGEILIKSPIRIDHDENALVMDMGMKEGEVFWFSMPPDFDIAQEIIDKATVEREAMGGDADALLIFSCVGRRPVLGPIVTMENEGLAEVWNSPMAGFFTYGEYGRASAGKQHFHSTACCWVALKEK